MSHYDDFARDRARPAPAASFGGEVFTTIREALAALAGGWRAAADYRRMSGLSDRQLDARGTSRLDLPREIHRRHFAGRSR